MSKTPSKRQSIFFAVIRHPDESRILMMPEDNGWLLPKIHPEEFKWLTDIGHINEYFRRELGIETLVLHSLYINFGRNKTRDLETIYAMENRTPIRNPPAGWRWIGVDNLSDTKFAIPDHQDVVERYLKEIESGEIPQMRPPWSRSGWFDTATDWIEDQLSRLGYELTTPIEQVRCWGISSVLRAGTTVGHIYFKAAASLPLFANEPVLMETLAALYPGNIPHPLAIDRDRRWMLLGNFGKELRKNPNTKECAEALKLFGEIQKSSANSLDKLLVAGCLDRSLEKLSRQFDSLLMDADLSSYLKSEEIERLQAALPRIRAMCAELAAYGVPHTLVHGDLHLSNIAIKDGQPIFFDWTDGCISHPFFDLVVFLSEIDSPEERELFRDTYLSIWNCYEPLERLLQAWQLAEKLGALHHTISYWTIVKNLEVASKSELEHGFLSWAREVLKWFE
jgi:hypothetical protein